MNNNTLSNFGAITLISIMVASLTSFLAGSATGTMTTVLVSLTLVICAVGVFAIAKLCSADSVHTHHTDMHIGLMGK